MATGKRKIWRKRLWIASLFVISYLIVAWYKGSLDYLAILSVLLGVAMFTIIEVAWENAYRRKSLLLSAVIGAAFAFGMQFLFVAGGRGGFPIPPGVWMGIFFITVFFSFLFASFAGGVLLLLDSKSR
ncbi:MAG: hypothetical protein KY468_01255 [Armatimonadetes bacterium]|nr:hypothetical protein [Armatimonadota bacterium]